MGGLFAAYGVLGQIIQRGRDGKGSVVRTGLFENCLLLVAQYMIQFDIEGTESLSMPERIFSWPVYDIFQTRDGRQIFLGAVTETQWTALCRVLGLENLLSGPRLQTRPTRSRRGTGPCPSLQRLSQAATMPIFWRPAKLRVCCVPPSPDRPRCMMTPT